MAAAEEQRSFIYSNVVKICCEAAFSKFFQAYLQNLTGIGMRLARMTSSPLKSIHLSKPHIFSVKRPSARNHHISAAATPPL